MDDAKPHLVATGGTTLPTTFSLLSTLALGFSMTNSWLGYSATFITPLMMGGSPAVLFGLIASSIACSFITAGLAELSSAFPSSGGQYHFAYMVSSPKHRALVAFVMGWLSVVAWCLTSSSTAIVCAQMIGSLASIYHPDFQMTAWQVWLIYCLILIIATTIVCLGHRAIPKGEIVLFVCSLVGFLASFITVLAAQRHKQPASVVLTQYENTTGWSDGTSFLIAAGNSMYAYLAIDGASHIAEELPKPNRDVPQAMGMTMLIGMFTVIPWTLAFLFSTTDLPAVTSSSIPIYVVYLQATSSRTAATIFTVWILLLYSGALVSCIVTTGRLAFAFARDGGLPFSNVFEQIHPRQKVPVNATLGCVGIIILYGLIYIGSTTAFNSFIAMSILSLNITYAAPQAILLVRGRERDVMPVRPVDLGRWLGPFCNAFSVGWVLLMTVIFCFPYSVPTTVESMNYVSVVITGVVVVICLVWVTGKRKSFVGPVVRLQGLEASPVPSESSAAEESTTETVNTSPIFT